MTNTKELAPIKKIETTLSEKLPQFFSGDSNKYIKSVLLEITKSASDPKKDLTACSPLSILTAVKQAVDLGLEIDSRQHCHLVKYGTGVQLQVGYRGFIYAIKRTYPDANIVVNLVKEGDVFTVRKGGDIEEFTHTIKDPFAGQDKIVGGYCYISFTLGNRKIAKIETVSKDEINKIKGSAKQDFIWKAWFEEKAKVAIIRRGCKVIFAGLNNEMLDNLVNKDNENFDFNQETKQEPKVINNLPPVNFEDDGDIVYTPEQLKEIEEAEKKAEIEKKAQELKLAKEGE
jgi:phage RecT family recombinase